MADYRDKQRQKFSQFLQDTVREAEARPPLTKSQRIQSRLTPAALAPLLWYRFKSADDQNADDRVGHILGRLAEEYPTSLYEYLPKEAADLAYQYKKDPSDWKSGWETAHGNHPLYNAAVWAMAYPQAISDVGEMVANEVHKATAKDSHEAKAVPFPDAYDNYASHVNTMTGGATDYVGILPQNLSYWKDVVGVDAYQARKDQSPWDFRPRSHINKEIADWAHSGGGPFVSLPKAQWDSRTYLERSRVPTPVAQILGPVMDMTLGLPPSLGGAVKAARQGKVLSPLLDLGTDLGVSTSHLHVVPWARKAMQGEYPWEAKRSYEVGK